MSYIISVPRIIAWVKRQRPEKRIGWCGRSGECLVAEFCKDTFKLNASVQPYVYGTDDDKGSVLLFRDNWRTNKTLSKAVCDLAIWFDELGDRPGLRWGVTAQEFLELWEARAA